MEAHKSLNGLENQMERAVLEMVNEISLMESQQRYCICEKFCTDAAALALNNLKPRYATSLHGSLYTLEAIQADQDLQTLIRLEVVKAMEAVAAAPRCPEPECPLLLRHLEAVELELASSSD
ncbi:late competence development ComFB family protein [Synechococcus sp. Nb3U1]|uniref:late competence development ComFB family protein n=1 Tax=Synechococcus sp. Nb3U1 TaxID=1914529 RepID=UPI001F48A674|nr:late competence development ComFB family protein [Synechococcus sp. Nb3U1]MCF2971674.1 late competence development ComFB family protein [Synechococcus sp. Nb3U1]